MYYLAALQGFFVFEMRCVAVALLIASACSTRGNHLTLALKNVGGNGGLAHVRRWDGSYIHSHDVFVFSFLPPSV